jgi:hypothetical protein
LALVRLVSGVDGVRPDIPLTKSYITMTPFSGVSCRLLFQCAHWQ